VVLCEAGATGVRGVVDEDSLGVGFDLGLEVLKVDFPLFLGNEVVVIEFDSEVLANRLAQGESRSCNKDTVTTLAQYSHCVVNCAGAAEREENVVRVDWVLRGSKLLCNGFTSRCGA